MDKESRRSFDGRNGGLEEMEIEKEFYHENSASRNSPARGKRRTPPRIKGANEVWAGKLKGYRLGRYGYVDKHELDRRVLGDSALMASGH